uniref:DNA-directed DNA polymerase n=1 Tax=Tanacetum cinerariifolium TaxID=118510 RepID=A0A699GL27_TANCI|nr:DNA-directed DNA polymerase [Tanacetum cinerariifolium]
MQTRSSSKFVNESSTNPISMNPKFRNRRRSKPRVEPFSIVEILVVTMADNRKMEEMLQAPMEGYGDAIVVPDILAENFEIRTGLLSLIQANQFHGFESNNPHGHIRSFNRITSTLKFRDVPNDAIKLMLFPYSLEEAAKIWYEKEPPRSILTWEDLHEQDSLNAAAGENLLIRTPRDTLTIIENKSKIRYSRHKPVASKVSTTSSGSSSSTDARIDKLMDTISNLVETFNKKMTTPAMVKVVEETCVICGGAHPYNECIATDSNTSSACAATVPNNQVQNGFSNEFVHYMKSNDDNMRMMRSQMNNIKTECQSTLRSQNNKIDQNQSEIKKMLACLMNNPSGSGSLPSNTIGNPRGDLKAITTRSGVSYDGPPIPPLFSFIPKVVERVPEVTKDTVQPSIENIQPSVVQTEVPIDEPVVASKPKPTIPYPSRVTKQKLHEKDDNLALKLVEIFRKLHFDLSFADALLHMPKFALMFKSLLNNKGKLFELATTPMNENCSTVILKKLPERLGDPTSFSFHLSLPELTPTRMILELADRSMTRPAGIAEDVFVKVGKFHFPTDFVVVDYVVDPHVPLILGRPFLRTGRALIDVYGEELTLRFDDEAITFKVACEEYVQEVLGFFDKSKSGNPTPISDLIIAPSSLSLTPFEGGDFILEEIEACLTSKSIPPGIDDIEFDLEGDIHLIEKLLNDDPSPSPLSLKELNVKEIKTVKTSIDEPPELELKELPSHLEYAFLEGTDKLTVIISKELKDEEKSTILKDDFKPAVQHQRRVNPKIHEVIKKEVIKLFDAGLIYPIYDSLWASPVHCVPKKGGMTIVENEDNELIPIRYFQVSIDLQDQEKTTFTCPYGTFAYRRMHFSLCNALGTFQRQMLKRREDTNLVLNWEKCHFMVKEGIVLGHKISKSGIEVDRDKVDVIAKLPHSTSVKGVRSFLGHAGFYRRFIQDFSKIARPMNHLLEKETPFIFSKECIKSFNTLKKKLTEAPVLVALDWDLPFEIMCDASDYAVEFVVIIRDKKRTENLAADHLSRLENPHRDELEKKEITETSPLETLGMIAFRGDSSTSWFSDIANYHAGNFIVKRDVVPTKEEIL